MSTAQIFDDQHPLLASISAARAELREARECRSWSLSDPQVVDALEQAMAARAQLDALTVELVGQAEARNLATQLDQSSTGRWLRRRFRLSSREAARLGAMAEALPRWPGVQSALADGQVSPEQAGAMIRSLGGLPATTGQSEVDRAQELLVEQAATLDPDELLRCGRALREVLTTTPDTDDPAEAARFAEQAELMGDRQNALQELRVRTRGDGMTSIGGLLAPLAGAAVRAALDGLASPVPGPGGERDQRRREQRMAAALYELALTALPGGAARGPGAADHAPGPVADATGRGDDGEAQLPGMGDEQRADGEPILDDDEAADEEPPTGAGERASGLIEAQPISGLASAAVSLVVRWELLQAMRGDAGQLDDGTELPPSALLAALCDAELLPLVFTGPARPLVAGRRRRLFSRNQRAALAARDRGCAFPGCTRGVARTSAHHMRHWAEGGRTDVDNGCLLCLYHHALVHRERWQARLGPDGYPEFVPPSSYDLHRRPRQHLRYSATE